MTLEEFNKKYEDYIEQGYKGLEINNDKVINYLDNIFPNIIAKYHYFKFSQIKKKFDFIKVYSSLPMLMNYELERKIKQLLEDDN